MVDRMPQSRACTCPRFQGGGCQLSKNVAAGRSSSPANDRHVSGLGSGVFGSNTRTLLDVLSLSKDHQHQHSDGRNARIHGCPNGSDSDARRVGDIPSTRIVRLVRCRIPSQSPRSRRVYHVRCMLYADHLTVCVSLSVLVSLKTHSGSQAGLKSILEPMRAAGRPADELADVEGRAKVFFFTSK